MLLSEIINDSLGRITKQLRFYCWHFRRDLDQNQRQELIQLLYEQHFERLANRIRSIHENAAADSRQTIGKLLFDYCLTRNRRHQLIQLIESELVDINVRLDNYGRTLLHRAAYNLDVGLVRLLIDQDVNIRLRDYAGNTALHIAIQSYRNGALIFGNGPDVAENLTSIIRLLLDADEKHITKTYERRADSCKRVKLTQQPYLNTSFNRHHRASQHQQSAKQIVQRSPDPNLQKQCVLDNNGNRVYNPLLCPQQILELNQNDIEKHAPEIQSTGGELNVIEKDHVLDGDEWNSQLLQDANLPLIDTKNAFGRTALHYCVLVVGERHLAHFVKLLLSFGADPDAVDTRMKTPLYCLVKRPAVAAVRQKCQAISHLIETGCDDLGLAIEKPAQVFTEDFLKDLTKNISNILQSHVESSQEPIFTRSGFQRVPSLKHLARLTLIKISDKESKTKRQTKLLLPSWAPSSLNEFMNRKILHQSELF